ncbi:MAG: HNH endonuclease signature motif containing protein [Citrobacter freundii]|nr:HNH endonuclease signature motif containing protein [Citrobacter freundii]
MKIKNPNETILLNGITIRGLLENIKHNRKGRLRTFLNDTNNWLTFISDNERLSLDFERTNNYTASTLNYSSIKEPLINLYNSSKKYLECKYISDIRELYRNLKCPYCGQGVCSTLDHYFDKDAFCELSLNVWNLVPSCGDCNFKKLNNKIDSPTERFLHPFFDDEFKNGSEMNLYFVKIELFTNPYIYILDLQPHPNLNANTKSVVSWHIKKMETKSRNGLIIRSDFAYWINKVKKKTNHLSDEQSILEYLREEYESEIDFSWRGVVLNSIISDNENFLAAYKIITNPQFSPPPSS